MTDRPDDLTPATVDRDEPASVKTRTPLGVDRIPSIVPKIIAGLGALVLIGMLGMLGFRAFYTHKVYPSVTIGDVSVGGLTVDQAAAKVQQRAEDLNANSISFTYKGKTWTPTLADIGATVDVDSSVNGAYALGRGEDATTRFDFTGTALRNGQTVPLKTVLNEDKLESWFDQVDKDIAEPAVNAGIVVKGNNEISFTPESTGTVVDRAEAKKQIINSLDTLTPITGELPTRVDQPRIVQADLEAGKAQVQQVLASPVDVTLNGKKWTIKPQDISQFLVVDAQPVPGSAPKVTVSFDQQKLSGYLRETYAGDINTKPTDATVYFDGSLKAAEPSKDGVTLMSDDFASRLASAYTGDHAGFEVPVHYTKPAVDSNNLGALHIESLIGRGDSNYSGGTVERDTNIEVGIQLLSGELVAPGEDFSFNHAIGPITTDNGFVQAKVILGEAIGTDVGGGICQVSTTMFRAALLAGFPMVDWYPHKYRLSGYELDGWGPGFDASILQADPNDPTTWGDFSFTNTTDSYILVQSYTDYPYAIVEIYGHDMGWKVDISDATVSEPIEPSPTDNLEVVDPSQPAGTVQQSAYPVEGYDVSFHRTVTAKDGKVLSDRTFETYFYPHGAQWTVSPDMQGKSPAKSG